MNCCTFHEQALQDEVVRVEGLNVYREQQLAVQNVSFSLLAGTDTAVVGPNGAGKSTLVQAVLGILPRQAGDVQILGESLSRQGQLKASVRQQIAYLPQRFWFDRLTPITVEELVSLGWDRVGLQWPWQGHCDRQQAVREALARVDARHLCSQLLSGLSGGETKRVLLAYCLVRPRKLLILDEAPAGLDVRSEGEFYRLLRELKAENRWAILQVSHDLDMVRQSCDRVICLNQTIHCQGKPQATLTAENLSRTYGSEFVPYHHACRGERSQYQGEPR